MLEDVFPSFHKSWQRVQSDTKKWNQTLLHLPWSSDSLQSLVEVAGSLWKSLQLLLHMPEAYHGSRCLFEEDHMHLGNPVNEGKELDFKFLQQLSVSQRRCVAPWVLSKLPKCFISQWTHADEWTSCFIAFSTWWFTCCKRVNIPSVTLQPIDNFVSGKHFARL